MTQPPRLLGARGAPPRSQQPAPLSPCGQISTLGQLPRINAEKPPGFAVQQEELEALAELCWPSPHICTPGLGVPTAFGHRSRSAQPLCNPQPSAERRGKPPHADLSPPQISQLWLPRPLQGQDELRGPAERQHFRTRSNALGKAAPRPPSTGSSPAEHIPPVGFSFSQTLNKTAARCRCSCPWRGSGNHPGGLVERSQLPEPGRDFVLFKQHGDLRLGRIC